ncbi:MAG: DUF348 domain-containing protein [Chloroflexi bacterium]|nr:DUF348 domain-containing protein [Chloroflexota bacterium]
MTLHLHRPLRRLPSRGRLHAAIVVSLAATLAIALFWQPLARSSADDTADNAGLPVLALAEGLSYAVRAHAEAVAGALAEAGLDSGPEGLVLRDGQEMGPHSAYILKPLYAAAGRVAALGAFSSGDMPIVLRLERAVPVTVQEEGLAIPLYSSQKTVGEALAAHGIRVRSYDRVYPPPDTPLSAGLQILVRHARAVELTVGGQTSTTYTQAHTVGELLAERGIEMGPRDELGPPAATAIEDGLSVNLVLVRVRREVEEEWIARSTIYQDDPNLQSGTSYVLDWGSDGLLRREYHVLYRNDRPLSWTLIAETYQAPQDQIVVRATYVPVNTTTVADCGSFSYTSSLTVYATWYDPASAGGYITATGIPVDYGVVAVDPSVIPLGTRMCIPGYGIGVAADTGGAIVGSIIDLGYPDGVIPAWTTRYVQIYILD